MENDLVIEALNKVANSLTNKNLEIWYDSKVQKIELAQDDTHQSRIILENDKNIQASLVIGADGANSKLRQCMTNLTYTSKDYKQMGLVGTITYEESETRDNIAFQKFMPEGPIALLPLCAGKASLVWTLPTSKAKEYKKLDPESLAKKLNGQLNLTYQRSPIVDGLNGALGLFLRPFQSPENSNITSLPHPKAAKVDNPACFPLGLGYPSRYVSQGAALIGDAAHRVHPLAGQGVNLGYSDVKNLVKALEDNVKHGKPFPSYDYLCEYETASVRHNLAAISAIDALQQLYCTDNLALVTARSLGLQFVNKNRILKEAIMAAAS